MNKGDACKISPRNCIKQIELVAGNKRPGKIPQGKETNTNQGVKLKRTVGQPTILTHREQKITHWLTWGGGSGEKRNRGRP